jgi:hypothetical protein
MAENVKISQIWKFYKVLCRCWLDCYNRVILAVLTKLHSSTKLIMGKALLSSVIWPGYNQSFFYLWLHHIVPRCRMCSYDLGHNFRLFLRNQAGNHIEASYRDNTLTLLSLYEHLYPLLPRLSPECDTAGAQRAADWSLQGLAPSIRAQWGWWRGIHYLI